MFQWAQKQLANVAGTQEPVYGPSAIRSVAEQAKTTPYTETTRDDFKWLVMDSTSVETKTFYMGNEKYGAFVQVIYSNVAGIRTTCQFNSKVFYLDGSKPHLWCSTQLHNHDFSEDKQSFYADDCALELSEDGLTYTVKSMNDENSIVNLTITQMASGFVAGKDGKTIFGTDLNHPWGTLRHAFWPRCKVEGTITTKTEGAIDFSGPAFYVYALQGMKPHHAAAHWKFVNFQGPNYSAVMMEYTTPPSYGSTVVSVGGIAKDGEIIIAGSPMKATHLSVRNDNENDWPEPEAVKFEWEGTSKDGKKVTAVLEGPLEERLDRVDIMAEVPGFVKKIVAGAAGTKPYIYQFQPRKNKLTLKLKIGDEEITESGELFSEATFIS